MEKKNTKTKKPVAEVKVPTEEKKVFGKVFNTSWLNVREEPSFSANIISQIYKESLVEIYENDSTEDFYKVCLPSGIDGYCNKKYICIQVQ